MRHITVTIHLAFDGENEEPLTDEDIEEVKEVLNEGINHLSMEGMLSPDMGRAYLKEWHQSIEETTVCAIAPDHCLERRAP